MKWLKWLSLLVILSLLAAACTSTGPSSNKRTTPFDGETELYQLLNQARSQARTCGGQPFAAVPALLWNSQVHDAAWKHSDDMVTRNFFGDIAPPPTPNGSTVNQRLAREGYTATASAENIAQNLQTAQAVRDFLLNDAAACANLMNPTFKHAGVGQDQFQLTTWTVVLASNEQGPAPTLVVTPTTAEVTVGGGATAFTATLTNSAETINWTLTGPGGIASTTGATTSYTPPATGGAGTATLTAAAGTLTANADITINAAPAGTLPVEVKDLQRQILVLPAPKHPTGLDLSARPAAPMAANPNGGAYILWTRKGDNKAFLTQVDATGNVVGADQDLGTGNAGAVGTNGTKVAYLLKTGENQMVFRVIGGGETFVVNNSQPGPWPDAATTFGNNAMLKPLDFRRVAVLPVGDNWFASFDHNNDFGAGGIHTGMSMVMLDGNGTTPTLGVPWGTSHSLDILAHSDGENIINVTVGDAFPQDFRLHVLTLQGQPLPIGDQNRVDLFGKNNFEIGGDTVNNVPGTGTGVSSGKLGGLSPLGGGQFALTYLIQNNPIPAKLNEIGMLTFDKQGTAKRFKLRDGSGIKYVRSARHGANILVAWETTAGKFFAIVVDAQGAVITAEQELAAGVAFSERDSFVTMANGDVMWAASVGDTLKLFRLPAP